MVVRREIPHGTAVTRGDLTHQRKPETRAAAVEAERGPDVIEPAPDAEGRQSLEEEADAANVHGQLRSCRRWPLRPEDRPAQHPHQPRRYGVDLHAAQQELANAFPPREREAPIPPAAPLAEPAAAPNKDASEAGIAKGNLGRGLKVTAAGVLAVVFGWRPLTALLTPRRGRCGAFRPPLFVDKGAS